jgi:hypothetical protein
VISPVEIHSGKPDNEGVNVHRGFGCGERSPIRDWRLEWGVSIAHALIIRNPLTNVKLDFRNRVTYSWYMRKKKMPADIREYFVKMGRIGGKKGGIARAANMTAEQLSESARNAVKKRWEKAKEKRQTAD